MTAVRGPELHAALIGGPDDGMIAYAQPVDTEDGWPEAIRYRDEPGAYLPLGQDYVRLEDLEAGQVYVGREYRWTESPTRRVRGRQWGYG